MLSLLLLSACSNTQSLTGTVTDIWGQPVSEATVVVEGVVERYHTDSAGKFDIELEHPPASGTARVMAGKEGYIKEILPVDPPGEEGADYSPVKMQLYPEPEAPGFYGVGDKHYVHLAAKRVKMVGTDLKHYAGVQDIPDETLKAGPVTFVFSSTLRPSELTQMDLHLTRLQFVGKTPMKGLLGKEDATVNLWVADQDVAFDLESLPSQDDYLIKTRDPLTPGVYAFHAQDVLNEEDDRKLLNLPKEILLAFPFEVN
jgi:hypothetical protein